MKGGSKHFHFLLYIYIDVYVYIYIGCRNLYISNPKDQKTAVWTKKTGHQRRKIKLITRSAQTPQHSTPPHHEATAGHHCYHHHTGHCPKLLLYHPCLIKKPWQIHSLWRDSTLLSPNTCAGSTHQYVFCLLIVVWLLRLWFKSLRLFQRRQVVSMYFTINFSKHRFTHIISLGTSLEFRVSMADSKNINVGCSWILPYESKTARTSSFEATPDKKQPKSQNFMFNYLMKEDLSSTIHVMFQISVISRPFGY